MSTSLFELKGGKMELSENFYSLSEDFNSPEIVQKFSEMVGASFEKTKNALNAVIPALLIGITDKSKTKDGAREIIDLASKQNISTNLTPTEITREKIIEGNEIINRVFEKELGLIVKSIENFSELSPEGVSRILALCSPFVMSVFYKKIKNEKLNETGLMNYLNQQKSSLMTLIPQDLSGLAEEFDLESKFGLESADKFGNGTIITVGAILIIALVAIWYFYLKTISV